MPYITREDGEHFVIPSYRDVLTAKQKSQLKREILALSQNYGEYITLQRKGAAQYEVAFSPDTGYLLGESIWHYFNRPMDMIYCEAIPNTTEAILVIVKAGSVYLDGSFPVESIPEELVIFLTQENNFEIYVYGNVPLAAEPEAGKFAFESSSVKKFQVLDKPVFPTLPLLKIYQLQLVDQVLKAAGIGVFPIKAVLAVAVIIGLAWMGYTYLNTFKPQLVQFKQAPPPPNPYASFYSTMNTSDPVAEVESLVRNLWVLPTMPGWHATTINYAQGAVSINVASDGVSVAELSKWAKLNNFDIDIAKEGFFRISRMQSIPKMDPPKYIYPLTKVFSEFVDRLARVYPGNHLTLGDVTKNQKYRIQSIEINLVELTPLEIELIGQTFKDLPFVFRSSTLQKNEQGTYTGLINVQIVGE